MRFKCKILLTKKEITCEYRRCFISFLKNAIQETGNMEFFEKYFSKTNVSKKPYTFSCSINVDKKENDKFLLKDNEITFFFSTNDTSTYYLFRTAIFNQRNKPFLITDHNYVVVTDIFDEKEKFNIEEAVIAKTKGYLCITKTNGNNKDRKYLTYEDDEFEDKFFEKTGLKFTPIECKTVKTMHFDSPIRVTSGTFLLQGEPEKIKEAYLNGLGDRSSQGYGYIDCL